MRALILLLTALIPIAWGQTGPTAQPVIRFATKLAGSGADSIAGVATDSAGNIYVAGTTSSLDFPTLNAIQPKPAGSSFLRVQGAQSSFSLSPAIHQPFRIAATPLRPGLVYAADNPGIKKSTDGGDTWAPAGTINSFVVDIQIDPVNPDIVYAAASDANSVYRSTDGGATWTPANSGLPADRSAFLLAIDPAHPEILFCVVNGGLAFRSTDRGGTWSPMFADLASNGISIFNLAFDAGRPGVAFAVTFVHNGITVRDAYEIFKSTDDGGSWSVVNDHAPSILGLFPDPVRHGTLYTILSSEIIRSTDDGATFQDVRTGYYGANFAADPASGTIYTSLGNSIIATSDAFTNVTPVGPAAVATISSIAFGGAGRIYAATGLSTDAFVAKLDPSGNPIWATYLGGAASDSAVAIAVDSAGSVFVTGTTASADFPVTKGAYVTTTPSVAAAPGASFLTKLSSDGAIVFSTYFADGKTLPHSITVSPAGEAILTGFTHGDLPVTQGAYQTSLSPACGFIPCMAIPTGFFSFPPTPATNAFVTKFNAAGSGLVFSTYVGDGTDGANGVALDKSGIVFIAGLGKVWELNATGSSLLASNSFTSAVINALALDANGNVYLTGFAMDTRFATTPGAFQSKIRVFPVIPLSPLTAAPDAFVMKLDPSLSIRYSTLLGGDGAEQGTAISVDGDGAATVVGFTTSTNFPLQDPVQTAFSAPTGFISKVSPDGSSLVYSTYLGDFRDFQVLKLALDRKGNAIFAGNTLAPLSPSAAQLGADHAFVGLVEATQPPALSVNAVLNAASENGVAIANGETIEVRGQGFGADARVVLEGTPLETVARGDGSIAAVIPADYARLPGGAGIVQVASGGQLSNSVLVPVADVSPGLFTADRSGSGQGYILNSDGTLNSASNPAPEGSVITILATGVGPISFSGDSAVTAAPVAVFIDSFYANGVDARFGPVDGLPGNVYQLRVYVPNPSDLVKNNPDLKNFKMPPQVPVTLKVGSAASQTGLILSVGGQ